MKKLIPLPIFLQSLGLSRKKILFSINDPKFLVNLEESLSFRIQGSLKKLAFLLLREGLDILRILLINLIYLLQKLNCWIIVFSFIFRDFFILKEVFVVFCI
jgi:hypothetical protein